MKKIGLLKETKLHYLYKEGSLIVLGISCNGPVYCA